jgi:Zn-finger nucleic acid-binding protein
MKWECRGVWEDAGEVTFGFEFHRPNNQNKGNSKQGNIEGISHAQSALAIEYTTV